MILKINYLTGVPAYRQIVDGIKEEIALGRLNALDEIPSVRILASQLQVNPNTVARAYRELIQEEVLYSRQGMGFYVRPSENTSLEFLREDLKHIIIEARIKNIPYDEVKVFMGNVLSEIYRDHPAGEKK